MYYISSQIIRSLVHFLQAQGLEDRTLTQLLASRAYYLDESRYRFPVEDYETLMLFAQQQLQCDHIGLKFGQSLKAQSWGLLGHLALVSSSLEKVLQHAQKLNTSVRNVGTIQLHRNAELSQLSWHANTPVKHYMVDELFSSWLCFAKHCCQQNADLALTKVQLTRQQPSRHNLKAYQTVFNCQIEFAAPNNSLWFKTTLLQSTLHSPNAELEQLLLAQAKNFTAATDQIDQLNAFIASQLTNPPTLEQAAQQLGYKKRTLQRYLTAHQCSYSSLLDDMRKYQAKLLIQQGITALEVANKLGFSEQSALQRAFKRWYGLTPKAFFKEFKN
ncbi:AraC family transcriptional regulator ligand-binding domain-containing protein [Pseudoalteromonas mariniglutinosa]|uniref:AraC family transcriptional regulator n=1 Tax=Pseudoalteromonas mariniglutinosa TaxID=206042 RepID=UPI00384BAE2B